MQSNSIAYFCKVHIKSNGILFKNSCLIEKDQALKKATM